VEEARGVKTVLLIDVFQVVVNVNVINDLDLF